MKSLIALGIYLRKQVVNNLQSAHKEVVVIEAGPFGTFTLMHDPEASNDTLFPKKLMFEPTYAMKPGYQLKVWKDYKVDMKPLDMTRLTRLCKDQSQAQIKKNLQQMASYMLQQNTDLQGKTLRVNLRIGSLVVQNIGSA